MLHYINGINIPQILCFFKDYLFISVYFIVLMKMVFFGIQVIQDEYCKDISIK